MRAETQRLYWSHPEIWYHVSPRWLIDDYGRPGNDPHCPDFARYIYQVEISFVRLGHEFRENKWLDPGRATTPIGGRRVAAEREAFNVETMARPFWEAFQLNFPAATRVVLSECCTEY